jgi:hypothetical protein
MKRRVKAGHPALSGMFTRAEVTYAWPLVTRTERDFVGHSGDAWRQQGVGFGA